MFVLTEPAGGALANMVAGGRGAPSAYYVDAVNGDDGEDGRSPARAWQTVAKVNASAFLPGDRVLFKRGQTWSGTRLSVPSSGIAGKRILIAAYGAGALPIITGAAAATGAFIALNQSYITVREIDFRAGTSTCVRFGGHNLTLEDCEISGGGAENFACSGVAASRYNIRVSRCISHNAATQGFYVGNAGGGGGPTSVIVEDCISYSNGVSATTHHGIYTEDGMATIVRRNTCYSNAAAGIYFKGQAAGANSVCERNKCYSNGQHGINTETLASGSLCIVRNNLCYANLNNLWVGATTVGCKIYHNTFVNATTNGVQVSTGASVTGNLFRNNIIVQDAAVVGNARCYRMANDASIANNTYNNNLLFYPNNTDSNNVAIRTSPLTGYTFAQWQALSGTPDINSIYDDPDFVANYTNLHILTSSPCKNAGAIGLGVTDDYDGLTRDAMPDMGAYEFA